ncbi:MAG: DUF3619 family protein [Gammaproteobacteria bacterium]
MRQDANEERFVAAMKAALDHRLESLDGETTERLEQVRRQVLATGTAQRPSWVQAAGLAAVAASALLVVSLWFVGDGGRDAPELLPLMEDLELLGAKQDIKFFEDLDFYLWLADEQQSG